jgi:hypothetical protein
MPVSDTFPYVEGKDGTESEQHVRLKGLAVYWLLTRGFDLEDIEEEHPVKATSSTSNTTGYTDVYAESDGTKVHVECEVGQVRIGQAASWALERGDAVFVFTEDGIHRLDYEQVESEPTRLNPSDETWTHTVESLTRISNLPMLDLSAYKSE